MKRNNSFHILAKPTGPMCNLDCTYCYYTEKEAYFPKNTQFQMSDEVLQSYIQQYIESQDSQEIVFAWQGGEPTLIGLEFYKRAVALQEQYANGKRITNTLQTNGTLLNDEWCEFFAAHKVLVGLSLDGPEHIHDFYRLDRGGDPSFERVMKGLDLLKKHQVDFNILTCVTKNSSYSPLEIYHFLKRQGIKYIQFIPVVEREVNEKAAGLSLRHSTPPIVTKVETIKVTPWTVESEMYGEFLIEIFDEWIQLDVGSVFVMNFEWALSSWAGLPSPICIFSEECGRAVALEHNGDLFSCDHYVYPEYWLGNIKNGLMDNVNQQSQISFGKMKRESLPAACRKCEVRFACHGECPKHRFLVTEEGEPGLNYLCSSYKNYFNHINPSMKKMKDLLQKGLPVKCQASPI